MMEVHSKTVLNRKDIIDLSYSKGRIVFIDKASTTISDDGQQQQQQQQQEKWNKLYLLHARNSTSTNEELVEVPVEHLGRKVILDTTGQWIVAAHQDNQMISVISIHHDDDDSEEETKAKQEKRKMALTFRKVINPKFKSKIHSFHTTMVDKTSIILVVSERGELHIISIDGIRKNHIQSKSFNQLDDIRLVHTVCKFSNDYMVVFGSANNEQSPQNPPFIFIAIRLSSSSSSSSNSKHDIKTKRKDSLNIKLVTSSPVTLPIIRDASRASKNNLLSACILPHCLILLFSDGALMVISPPIRTQPHQILKKENDKTKPSLQSWFPSTSASPSPSNDNNSSSSNVSLVSSCSVVQSVILTTSPETEPTTRTKFGNIVELNSNLIAISYGECVSVWDTVYHVGHLLHYTKNQINHIIQKNETSNNTNINELLTWNKQIGINGLSIHGLNVQFSLANAARSKIEAPCASIVRKDKKSSSQLQEQDSLGQKDITKEQMFAHPIIEQLLTTFAYAGGDVKSLFSRPLKEAKEKEINELRSVLSRGTTSNAENLRLVAKQYYQLEEKDEKQVNSSHQRRIARQEKNAVVKKRNSETSKSVTNNTNRIVPLPSTRFAAAFIARCMYEISFQRNMSFVIPLIDMLSTGVVCGEDSLAALHAWKDDHEQQDSRPQYFPSSIVDVILLGGELFNVLEAIIEKVAALREDELVRIMQFCVRVCAEEVEFVESKQIVMEKESSSKEKDWVETGEEIAKREMIHRRSSRLRKARNLLRKCMQVGTDNRRTIECIRQVPFDDILALLSEFSRLLYTIDDGDRNGKGQRSQKMKKVHNVNGRSSDLQYAMSHPEEYRGINRWLDRNAHDTANLSAKKPSVMEGYVTWITRIIDAHFSNLVMDENGLIVTEQLLATVDTISREREALRDLEGLTLHLYERKTDSGDYQSRYKFVEHLIPQEFSAM